VRRGRRSGGIPVDLARSASYRPGLSSFQGCAMDIVRNRAIDLNRADLLDIRAELLQAQT
jgi:hypothetical protein